MPQPNQPTESQPTELLGPVILRWTGRILLGIFLALAVIYLGDYAVFLLRGSPMDAIQGSRYLAAPIKGDNTALYSEGDDPLPCAKALFPRAGYSPCWKLRRHPSALDPL